MTNEQLATWIKALRSGDFKQCRGHLTHGIERCCLGVAASVLTDKPVREMSTHTACQLVGILVPGFEKGQGIGLSTIFVGLNDKLKWSFVDIAKWAEDHQEEITGDKSKDYVHWSNVYKDMHLGK